MALFALTKLKTVTQLQQMLEQLLTIPVLDTTLVYCQKQIH